MFLRMALSMAHEDWKTRRERTQQGLERAKSEGRMKGRPADKQLHKDIIQLALQGVSITRTAGILSNAANPPSAKCGASIKKSIRSAAKDQLDIFKAKNT